MTLTREQKIRNQTVRFKGGLIRESLGLEPDDALRKEILIQLEEATIGNVVLFRQIVDDEEDEYKETEIKVTDQIKKQAISALIKTKRMEESGSDEF